MYMQQHANKQLTITATAQLTFLERKLSKYLLARGGLAAVTREEAAKQQRGGVADSA